MKVKTSSEKLGKMLADSRALQKKYGKQVATKVNQRYAELRGADNLSEISTNPPTRLHPLQGTMQDTYAIDLTSNVRMVVKGYNDDGEQTTNRAEAVEVVIVDILDYH